MWKLKSQFNLIDISVFLLGLFPIAIYICAPFLVDYFELRSMVWGILLQLTFLFCIGFPVAAILYFWWRVQR
jgi:hypothetical protein